MLTLEKYKLGILPWCMWHFYHKYIYTDVSSSLINEINKINSFVVEMIKSVRVLSNQRLWCACLFSFISSSRLKLFKATLVL